MKYAQAEKGRTFVIRLERFERESIYESTAELMMKFVAENEAAGQKSASP